MSISFQNEMAVGCLPNILIESIHRKVSNVNFAEGVNMGFDDFAKEVKQKAEQVASQVQEKAPEVADKAKELFDQAQEKAPEVFEQVKESGKEFVENAKELAEDATRAAQAAAEEFKRKEHTASHSSKNYVRVNPDGSVTAQTHSEVHVSGIARSSGATAETLEDERGHQASGGK